MRTRGILSRENARALGEGPIPEVEGRCTVALRKADRDEALGDDACQRLESPAFGLPTLLDLPANSHKSTCTFSTSSHGRCVAASDLFKESRLRIEKGTVLAAGTFKYG
jgi:hypothetical protein